MPISFELRHRGAISAVLAAACLAIACLPARAGPALLFEPQTDKVLYAEDADQLWHPASLTKIMTAYLTFEAIANGKLTLESKLAISELAHTQQPSKVGLPVGAEVTVDFALKALIIKSANDIAVALAEKIGGSVEAFAERMNATAKRLGMNATRFRNPHGLPDPEQVTTARDLAKLSTAVVRDYPQYASLWSMNDMRVGRIRLRTHNALLRTYEGADGLKTGFICDSGFNVVGSATREGRRLMVVVLGEVSGRDRAVRAASLLEHGFQTYGWKELFSSTTLNSLPKVASAGPVSVRSQVVSWACGNRPRRKVATKGQKARAAAARRAKGKAGSKPRARPSGKATGKAASKATAKPKVGASSTSRTQKTTASRTAKAKSTAKAAD
jgi:D-alanyl-D-alanine carboxypeptidase